MPERTSQIDREFGDFQTPALLAASVCDVLMRAGVAPAFILEPTCGHGSFVSAAATAFPTARILGVDINQHHLAEARTRLAPECENGQVKLVEGDFFTFDWGAILASSPDPLLVIGNPTWVTTAELGALASLNVPSKSNVQGWRGIEAITGKSNFDISEWMLLRYLDWLRDRGGWIAVLVKTSVARKLLVHAWQENLPIGAASIYPIDAMKHFGAAVDACLFLLTVNQESRSHDCAVFDSLNASIPSRRLGFHDGMTIADVATYLRWRHLAGNERHYAWRSGIKHDCSKVLELKAENGHYVNGFGETIALEDSYLYPLFKSSDVSKGAIYRQRFMLVTQQRPGESTAFIHQTAPLTWAYLQGHATLLEQRRSSIYRNRPPFSIFGVGAYSFAPWKVAISGFYKSLRFVSLGPANDRPPVVDDTVYFVPCRSEAEAEFLTSLLSSTPAQEFYGSLIHWSDKRPITSDLLKRLDLAKLAAELGMCEEYDDLTRSIEVQAVEESQIALPGLA